VEESRYRRYRNATLEKGCSSAWNFHLICFEVWNLDAFFFSDIFDVDTFFGKVRGFFQL
jgi:hypothetical protein